MIRLIEDLLEAVDDAANFVQLNIEVVCIILAVSGAVALILLGATA